MFYFDDLSTNFYTLIDRDVGTIPNLKKSIPFEKHSDTYIYSNGDLDTVIYYSYPVACQLSLHLQSIL